nr:hypothetical protein [Okeania sp. KiyG1]
MATLVYLSIYLKTAIIHFLKHSSRDEPGENPIVGNTCLYGATGGVLLVNGRTGERFALNLIRRIQRSLNSQETPGGIFPGALFLLGQDLGVNVNVNSIKTELFSVLTE